MRDRVLAANLIEISYAESSHDLVAFKSRIYHASYGIGRFIKWLLNALPCLGAREEILRNASNRTRILFFKRIEQLSKARLILEKEIKRRIKGKPLKNTSLTKAQDMLHSFCCYFDPFMKIMRKESAPKAFSFLTANLSQKNAKKIAINMKDLFQDLHFYKKIFHLEDVTKSHIPFDLLNKLSFDLRLKVSEKKRVIKWINQLKISDNWKIPSFQGDVDNSYVRTRGMHRLLCRIVKFTNERFPKQDVDFDAEVEALEANLINLGYTIFDQPDQKHIAWRKTINKGEKIAWNGKKLKLGKILHNRCRAVDEPVIFSVKNQPDLEVVIYHNESWSYTKRFQESILHCGIKGRKILGMSDFGRIVIQERLYDTLEDITWEATSQTEVTENDVANAKPIVDLIRALKYRPFTPMVGEQVDGNLVGRLLPEHFAFNHFNELKAVECLIPGHFSFDTLENFAFDCAKGNNFVFSYIMRASDVRTTSQAKQYKQLFADALKGKDKAISVTRNSSIIDKDLIAKRENYYRDAQQLLVQGFSINKNIYQINNIKVFKSLLIKNLMRIQKVKCPGSILDPYIFSEALFNTLITKRPPLKKAIYEQKIEEIIRGKDRRFTDPKNNDVYEDYGIFCLRQISRARRRIITAMQSV